VKGAGGAILAPTVKLTNCILFANTAASGGGI